MSHSSRPESLTLAVATLLALQGLIVGNASAQKVSADFSFIQLSDPRVAPRFLGDPEPKAGHTEATFRWIADELKHPARIGDLEIARPSFVVCTGGITEFGAPAETWKDVERIFGLLGLSWYPVAGASDNTWNPIAARISAVHPAPDPLGMRNTSRSPSGFYSFDACGCHCVVLDSATIHDPRPVLDVEQLAWLRSDLTLLARMRPVFLFMAHPPDSAEFAQPFQLRMLMDAIDGANIVVVFYGGGSAVEHRLIRGLDCIGGGGVSAAEHGGERGYNAVSVQNDVLRVEFRPVDPDKTPRLLLEKSLVSGVSTTSFAEHFEFLGTKGFAGKDESVHVEDRVVHVLERVSGPKEDVPSELSLRIDGEPIATEWRSGHDVTEAERNRCGNAGRVANATWDGWFEPIDLAPGAHLVTVEMKAANGIRRERTVRVHVAGGPVDVVDRELDGLGSLRTGVIFGKNGLRATAPGYFVRMTDPGTKWGGRNKTVAGVIGIPAYDFTGNVPVLVAPAPSGFVCGLRADQDMESLAWRYDTNAPVYGSVLVSHGIAYVGDAAGRMHAIDTQAHAAKWVFETNGSSIEVRPTLVDDLLVFGAWDGNVYALKKDDGTLAWKRPGACFSRGGTNARCFAPADCSPVALGDKVFVCDAGNELAVYSLSGDMTRLEFSHVAAIGGSEDGAFLYLRGTDDVLTKIAPDGVPVWRTRVELGHTPAAPIEKNGVVYVCSDRGQVAWIDAHDGKTLATYQATPGAYVMAQLSLDDTGTCWVSGMDGSLTGLRAPTRTPEHR